MGVTDPALMSCRNDRFSCSKAFLQCGRPWSFKNLASPVLPDGSADALTHLNPKRHRISSKFWKSSPWGSVAEMSQIACGLVHSQRLRKNVTRLATKFSTSSCFFVQCAVYSRFLANFFIWQSTGISAKQYGTTVRRNRILVSSK